MPDINITFKSIPFKHLLKDSYSIRLSKRLVFILAIGMSNAKGLTKYLVKWLSRTNLIAHPQ